METQSEPKAVIKLPKDTAAFSIETDDHLPKLHQLLVANGKRGSGKSLAITNLLRMYKEQFKDDLRILIVSPTFGSNYAILKDLGIKKEDVFDEPDDNIAEKLIKICDDERDDFLEYEHLVKYYNEFIKRIKGQHIGSIDTFDEYMLQYYNPETNQFEKPKPKYKRYLQGKPPVLITFIDDSQGAKLLSTDKKNLRLCLRHRHLGQFPPPRGGAVGMSLLIATQSFKSQGGLNKAIRNNATSMICFKSKDISEVNQVADAFSGEIPKERFIEMYAAATEEEHSFLYVDLHYKKGIQPSGFRKRFDTYLIPSENDKKDDDVVKNQ
jgi:hypothetical protein